MSMPIRDAWNAAPSRRQYEERSNASFCDTSLRASKWKGRAALFVGIVAATWLPPGGARAATPRYTETNDPPGAVSGVVRASETGQPIPGVRIEVIRNGMTTYTDSTGIYRLRAVPAGPVEFRISCGGHAPLTMEVFVPAGGMVRVDVALVRQVMEPVAARDVVLRPIRIVAQSGFITSGIGTVDAFRRRQ
jgi:hypothetical protein